MTKNITTLEEELEALALEGKAPINDELQALREEYLRLNDEKKAIETKQSAIKAAARKIYAEKGVSDFVDENGKNLIGEFDSTSIKVDSKALKVAHPRIYKRFVTESAIKTFYCKR